VFIRGRLWLLIPAILAISPILAISFASLCLRPTATTPPPIELLLQTKGEMQFDRAVDRTVKAIFYVFQQSNLTQFQPDFFVFAFQSAEGRNSKSCAAHQSPRLNLSS
jgi:hypothetical protein